MTLRAPRAGLALVLAAPVFPLGNVAQAAALAYGLVALAWLGLMWRDARAGLAFCAGPVLAPLGLIGLVPLAVQPARGAWRRGLHAATGLLVAASLAGLAGRELPLTGARLGSLGLGGAEDPREVVQALAIVLRGQEALLTTSLALALAAMALPLALRRGPWAVGALGLAQVVAILAWAPSLPWPGIVLSTLLATALLVARPATTAISRSRAR